MWLISHGSRILQNGDLGSKALSSFALPPLHPPENEIVALLDVPAKASLHVPISFTLTVRNYHPSRAANITVQLETESLDAFVVSGLRHARVPVLLPGSEEKLVWRMIPIECGYVKTPRIRVIDRRKAIPTSQNSGETGVPPDASTGDVIKVIDLRRDVRTRSAGLADSEHTDNGSTHMEDKRDEGNTILVLP